MSQFELADTTIEPGSHRFVSIPVTQTLQGDTVEVPIHVVHGDRPGPTLGLLGADHGAEALPVQVFHELLAELDPMTLSGTLLIVPASNPLALAAFRRETPEIHLNTDLEQVFPGRPDGSLTQMIASTITTHVLDRVDYLIDLHWGGTGGRLQRRTDFHQATDGQLRKDCVALCRAANVGIIHENNLAGSAVAYIVGQGKPGINVEIGGSYLARPVAAEFIRRTKQALRNVMGQVGMLEETAIPAELQVIFRPQQRIEVSPHRGGYLIAEYGELEHLGQRISAGTLLGTVVDCQTLEVVEQLTAPVDGILVSTRYSGVLEAGSQALMLAQLEGATWV